MKINLVMGEKSEYSDWTTWVAAGFFNGDTAKTHAERLNKIVNSFVAEDNADLEGAEERAVKALSELDPKGYPPADEFGYAYLSSYSAPLYEVVELELGDTP